MFLLYYIIANEKQIHQTDMKSYNQVYYQDEVKKKIILSVRCESCSLMIGIESVDRRSSLKLKITLRLSGMRMGKRLI